MPVKRVIRILALMYACLSALAAPPAQITLSKDGWFRTGRGELFVPLGGFHANVLPLSRLNLTAEERAKVAYVWSGQKTDDQGHVERPIQAVGGYQLTWLKDAKSPLWIAYLRKRKVETYRNHHVGVPDEAPLEVRFDLPKGRYRVRSIDLTDNRDESRPVAAKDSLTLSGKTNHDYVLVVSR